MIKLEKIYPLMLEAFSLDKTFSFPIKGTSMLPLLRTDDVVTIKKIENDIQKGDILLFKRNDGSFILHRVNIIKKDYYLIVGDHQTKKEKVLFDQIISKVINYQKKKNNKTYYMKGIRYSLYKFIVKFKFIRFIFSHIYK